MPNLKELNEGFDRIKTYIEERTTELVEEQERKMTLDTYIGFLRQWLNEDRINDPKKMVTNSQIESWLWPLLNKAEAGEQLAKYMEQACELEEKGLKKNVKSALSDYRRIDGGNNAKGHSINVDGSCNMGCC